MLAERLADDGAFGPNLRAEGGAGRPHDADHQPAARAELKRVADLQGFLAAVGAELLGDGFAENGFDHVARVGAMLVGAAHGSKRLSGTAY